VYFDKLQRISKSSKGVVAEVEADVKVHGLTKDALLRANYRNPRSIV
jgi:hypothetical protein